MISLLVVSIWKTRMVVNLSEDFTRSCQPLGLKDWPEQHRLCRESSSCADLHVRVHLRAARSFQREVKSTLSATGIASATAGDCSWSGILFYQERSMVIWHWAGMVLLSRYHFFHTSQMFLGLDYETQNLFSDCSSCCITVQKMFTWLSLSVQPILTTLH